MSIQTSEQAELERLRAEVERLRGLLPELPPRPPDGTGQSVRLPRYGLRWNGRGLPVSVPMDDGYWTPWHIAQAEVEALRVDAERYRWLRDIATDDDWEFIGDHTAGRTDDAIDAAMREQAMQELVDQAQELGMGYGERE